MKNQIPNITALRFFLALLVMLFHIPQFSKNRNAPFYNDLSFFHKGTEAVYVFFALSGFLIIRQLYVEKNTTSTISIKKFFIRRALRIFPVYYLVLTIGLLYYNIVLPKAGFDFESNYNIFVGIGLSVFCLPNVFSILYSPGGIIEVLWSIGIEEQFYLLIAPLLYFISPKHILRFLLLFSIGYFLIYFSDSIIFLKKFSMLFFYFSISGLVSILLLQNKHIKYIEKLRHVFLPILFIYFTTNIFKINLSEFYYHLFSCILFSVSIGILSIKPLPILNDKNLIYLGKISYGIYAYHVIVMQLIGILYLKIIKHYNWPDYIVIIYFYFATITLTIIISHFSYKHYETYFLKLKN